MIGYEYLGKFLFDPNLLGPQAGIRFSFILIATVHELRLFYMAFLIVSLIGIHLSTIHAGNK